MNIFVKVNIMHVFVADVRQFAETTLYNLCFSNGIAILCCFSFSRNSFCLFGEKQTGNERPFEQTRCWS